MDLANRLLHLWTKSWCCAWHRGPAANKTTAVAMQGASLAQSLLDLNKLVPHDKSFYSYVGSLVRAPASALLVAASSNFLLPVAQLRHYLCCVSSLVFTMHICNRTLVGAAQGSSQDAQLERSRSLVRDN